MNSHQSTLDTNPLDSQGGATVDIIIYRDMTVSRRSTVILWFMRVFAKRFLAMMGRFSAERLTKRQVRTASMACKDDSGIPIRYDIVGRQPGHVFGSLGNTDRPVILWLHGGAFSLPAAPDMHLRMVANLCRQLDADAFMPDYRLTPASPFPAGLNDCEQAYRELLAMGYKGSSTAARIGNAAHVQ